MVYCDYDDSLGIWYRTSADNGATWSEGVRLTASATYEYEPRIMQAADGRLWMVYISNVTANPSVWYRTSDDVGATWNEGRQLTTGMTEGASSPAIVQAADGRILVAWRANDYLRCKTSSDGGQTWTGEQVLAADLASRVLALARVADGALWVVWQSGSVPGSTLAYRKSTDNGLTWSDTLPLPMSGGLVSQCSLAEDASGRLWLAWSDLLVDSSVWYATSSDRGDTWSPAVRYTSFMGMDSTPALVPLADGRVGVAWESNRSGATAIWFGILGEGYDVKPPPFVWYYQNEPSTPQGDDAITFRAVVWDEIGVDRVELVWTLDGTPQPDMPMYDDGAHGDGGVGDAVYGVQLAPLPAGTVVSYQVRATDVDGNTFLAYRSRVSFTVLGPFMRTADILLVLDQPGGDTASLRRYYTDALNDGGYRYDVWDASLRGAPGPEILDQYTEGQVIWSAPGPWWTGFVECDASVRQALRDYLGEGGRLFITGQNIAERLAYDQAFLADCLHVSFVRPETGLWSLSGVAADPIGAGLTLTITGGDGANNQSSADEIAPIVPAVPVFTYLADGAPAGVGGVRVETWSYKVVYFAFGLEAISTAADRARVMEHVLSWLSIPIQRPEAVHVDPSGSCGGRSPCVTDIQAGIDAVAPGGNVHVAAGVYSANLVIKKPLTLEGEGSGVTRITTSMPNNCIVGVKAGGSSLSERLVIRGLTLFGASGNGSPAIWLTEHASRLTIDNVAMVGNAGPGLVMGATGTITDVVVNNCLFANNLSGLSVGPGGAVVGLSITNSRFEGNACYGLNVAGHGGTTDLTVADTTFAGNGAAGVMAQSSANISLWGYNGSATLRNVTIDASQALYGIVINGEWQEPARPMGAVSFSNVRVTGSPVLQSGVSIGHYSDARGLGIDGLDVNADVMPGLDPWGNRHAALLMVDLSSPSPIVLKNTSFAGSRGPVELGGEPAYDLVASLADVDASGVTFSSADDFAIEDLVHHRLDQEWLGLVMRSAGNVWVTPRSGSLQRGVNAVAAGGTVHVAPGAYYEPMMTIKKPVRLCSAAGSDDTIIYNTSGSPSVIVVASSSVTIEGFTVRGGTGVAGVHRPALYARSEDGSQLSGITVRNCRFAPWDMQAIALHNVANCSLENNTFEVHLSPGSESPGAMLEIAGVAGLTATGNRFSGETDGVEVLGEGDGLGESTGIRLFNNSFSDLAGQPIHNGATSLVDASGNWWGTNSAAAMTATVGANVDYTPWLDSGTDLSSAIGFQGDFSALWADASSPQAGDKHPVQEAIDLVTSPGVVRLAPGTYAGGIVVDKPGVTLIGSDGTVIGYGSPAVTIAANNVTVSRIHAEGAGAGAGTAGIVVTSGVANPVIQNCEVAHWPADGIVFEGGVISPTLSANVIEENAGNAILFQGEVVAPTLTGNTIADNTGDAILFAADVSDPTVTDNTVTGNTGGGITFTQPPAGEVTISGNAGWLPITTSATPNPAPVGTVITLSATVGDGAAGSPRIISAEYSLDGTDTWLAMVPRDGGFDSSREEVTASLGSYSSPGVIQVWVRGADAAGNTSVPQCVLVAVYDPAAGFVTGGGWIVSPPGAYTPDNPGDLDVTGRASFAFVSRYKKGATVPTGQTEFQFQAGNLNFHSEVYDWLVVAGSKAQYKGTGTINGTGQYGFMLTAVDGDLKGREPDKFRIKIWEKATGTIVYDNQAGAGDTADPTTTLGGGNIVIHP